MLPGLCCDKQITLRTGANEGFHVDVLGFALAVFHFEGAWAADNH
ncbi:hypothetical protein GRAN_5078 [Granulicella sibirica]|uniref:Uncharacterized protein n=1 Tax=Granulicella sibirica TaxID=2479048 RepID=A0A4Q0SUY3_9BACT|nr:hypothetical protein GRAN_5078 [Granulicella sibirica]